MQSLQNDTQVAFIEADSSVEIASNTKVQKDHRSYKYRNKESQTIPWGIYSIGADIAHVHQFKGQSIKIAVLDTGIADHPDLRVFGGISFVDGVIDYTDDNGHGTHIAGTIAALDNSEGVVGGAPHSKIYAVKVLNGSGAGSYSQVIQGIEWAINQKMDIISMSFGGTEHSQALHEVIQEANDQGILVIAAAGNRGSGEVTELFPALFPEVISVGAVTQSHDIASYSSRGSKIDLVAPGSGILSTTNDQDYGVLSGTSMATPHVTSAAALLWAKNKSLSNQEVRDTLFNTATPIGDANTYGHGLVNIAKGLGLIDHAIIPVVDEGQGIEESPTNDTGGDVSISAYDKRGSGQTITAGDSASVSIKLSEAHSTVYIGVFNPAGDKIAGSSRRNIEANDTVSYTWYSSSSTPAGTYRIKFAYSGTNVADYFTIYVEAPEQEDPQPPSAPRGLSTSSITTSGITLSWSGVSGATEYKLRRDGRSVGTTARTSYHFSGLTSDTSYKLEVAFKLGLMGTITQKKFTFEDLKLFE